MAVNPVPLYPTWVAPIPPREDVNKVAAASKQGSSLVLASGRRAPLIYGETEVQGQLAAAAVYGNFLYLVVVWGLGEIQEIVDIYNGDTKVLATNRVNYLGTSSQGVDPWMASAISGYADTLRGTVNGRAVSFAYSVIRTSSGQDNPGSSFSAIVKGRKIYDPRGPSTAWSSNAALALSDLLTMAGETMDFDSVETTADFNDELVGSHKRWTLNLALNTATSVPSLINGLRAYAHCLVVKGSNGIKLIPDKATSTTKTLTASSIVQGSLKLSRAGRLDTPTVVRVDYTRTASVPYSAGKVEIQHDGISAGTVPWRESNVSMPGINSYQEANRAAIERFKGFWLRDLNGALEVFDEGLEIEAGDVVSVTHPVGLTNKLMRVLETNSRSPGRWGLRLEEYDPAVYTDSVALEPTYTDTDLPDPFTVPAPTDLSAEEEVYQLQTGIYSSRFRVSWNSDSYPYGHKYRVQVIHDGNIITTAFITDTEFVTGPIQEEKIYTVKVAIVADIGVTGSDAEVVKTAQGKQLVPGDVDTLNGFEVGGEVRLSWTAADDIDIWRYDVRYGVVAALWDNMTRIDLVDGLRLNSKDIPPGEWDFAVKAVDSIKQSSAVEARRTITVTLDTKAFFVGAYELAHDDANSYNLYTDTWRDGTIKRWTEEGNVVNDVFTGLANSYTDVAASYDGGSAELFSANSAFDDAAWTKGNVTVSANTTATTDPDGGNNADILQEITTAGAVYHLISQSPTLEENAVYRFSIYLKAGTRSYAKMVFRTKANVYLQGTFNLTAGTKSSSGTLIDSGMTDVGNGWYLCWITMDTGSGATATLNYIETMNEAGSSSLYIGTAQDNVYIYGASLTLLSQSQTISQDFGDTYVGNWAIDASCFSALGTGDEITTYLELSTDDATWGPYTDPAVKASARYARVRSTATGGNVLFQEGDPIVRLDVVTREETGTVTCASTDTEGTPVQLTQQYSFVNGIWLQPSGTTALKAVYDDVQIGPPTTFKVYLFDAAEAREDGPVTWTFQGV